MLCVSCHRKYDLTEKGLLKLSKAHLGKKHSKKSKLIMSIAKIGKNNPMYGRKHTKKSKLMMSMNIIKYYRNRRLTNEK